MVDRAIHRKIRYSEDKVRQNNDAIHWIVVTYPVKASGEMRPGAELLIS